MDLFAIGFGIFIATVLIIQLVMYGVGHMRTTQRVKIRKRLRKLTYVEGGSDGAEILKKRALSDIPFLNSLLGRFPGLSSLDRLMVQANARYPMGFYILLGLFLAVLGLLIGSQLARNTLLAFTGVHFGRPLSAPCPLKRSVPRSSRNSCRTAWI
jgi:tight adherence protein B